jgi:transcription-repair coupling factor (superfamily II helicase)
MKVVLLYDWEKPAQRLHGTTAVLRNLVRIAEQAKAA